MLSESLVSPAKVADKIGDRGMDLSKMVAPHILDKIDEMIPDEEKANRRSEDVFQLVKQAVDTAAANAPIS